MKLSLISLWVYICGHILLEFIPKEDKLQNQLEKLNTWQLLLNLSIIITVAGCGFDLVKMFFSLPTNSTVEIVNLFLFLFLYFKQYKVMKLLNAIKGDN
jgi:hypothetical protein